MKRYINGFTLAEIMVAIGVSSVILLILTQIFFSSIRGSNKSQLITVLNQSGKNILDNLETSIRSADLILCPRILSTQSSASLNTLVLAQSGKYTRYRWIEIDNALVRDMPVPTEGEAEDLNVFIRTVCTIDTANYPDLVSLTDSGIAVSAPPTTNKIFNRTKIDGKNKDTLSIKFNLKPANQSFLKIPGTIDEVLFSTTIEVR